MLHYVVRYTNDASDSPVLAELNLLGVPHRVFARYISLKYRNRFELVARVYPRLLWFAVTTACRSLALSRPAPDAVVIGTEVEALVFGLCRLVLRRRTLVVYETVILKDRPGAAGAAFRAYYEFVLSLIGLGVCHSGPETARYTTRFAAARGKLVTIPYATALADQASWRARAQAADARDEPYVVAAGRSGRDYATLARAVETLPCRLKIICDVAAPLQGLAPSPRIDIERACFGDAYLQALAGAVCVVIPLSVDDISAGQMVLLQAACMGKAVILTRTTTTEYYATHGQDALLVNPGDAADLRAAIARLLDDPAERRRIGENAMARSKLDHSTEAYVRRLVAEIGQRLPHGL